MPYNTNMPSGQYLLNNPFTWWNTRLSDTSWLSKSYKRTIFCTHSFNYLPANFIISLDMTSCIFFSNKVYCTWTLEHIHVLHSVPRCSLIWDAQLPSWLHAYTQYTILSKHIRCKGTLLTSSEALRLIRTPYNANLCASLLNLA